MKEIFQEQKSCLQWDLISEPVVFETTTLPFYAIRFRIVHMISFDFMRTVW